MRGRWAVRDGVVLAVCLIILCGISSMPARANIGAGIYVAGDVTHHVEVFRGSGAFVDRFNAEFTYNDGFALGDVNADGVDEVVVAGDETGTVEIYDPAGIFIRAFDGHFTDGDEIAVGDVLLGNDGDEIVIAGDVTGNVEIFSGAGVLLHAFHGAFTSGDGLAVGDVTLLYDGEEIVIAGDGSGIIDVFRGDGFHIIAFDGAYSEDDALSAGDVNGDGIDEIVTAGDVTGTVEVWNVSGARLAAFDGHFTFGDGLAVGDVLRDQWGEEIVIAGDQTGIIEIWNGGGGLLAAFDGHYTEDDALAVSRRPYADQDGDGLMDHWERYGLDLNSDGVVDLDLPGMGADPLHKDLFLELDYMVGVEPTRSDVQQVKEAFALAPIDAGGVRNPDGRPGINLWIDTGALTDANASEDGSGWTTCGDGIDNGGDGVADALDPDCLVGDNLGGGNAISPIYIQKLNVIFYHTKSENFAPNRKLVFRYGMSALHSPGAGGGWGEVGGNDFIEFNHNAGTIMHEFGHNLGLKHGGHNDHNCKPNYVSVMNYDLAFCIPQVGGGCIIDYSPPRTPSGRGVAPLPTLIEAHLDETLILDPTDQVNEFIFTASSGSKVRWRLDKCVCYNADLDCDETDLAVQIDVPGLDNRPADCFDGYLVSVLHGSDDWSRISLPFRQDGDADDGPINPTLTPDPNMQELLAMWETINSTDLVLTMSDSADPAVAGEMLTYTVHIENEGPNPASAAEVLDLLPPGVTYDRGGPQCAEDPAGTVTCTPPELRWGETMDVTIEVLIAPDLVYNAGGPTTITNSAEVDNTIGVDLSPGDEQASETTKVVAQADLEIAGFAPVVAPSDVVIGEPVDIVFGKTIANNGPSSPMDVRVTMYGSAPAGSSVTVPAPFVETAVATGPPRVVQETVTIVCGVPGEQSFSFGNAIEPADPRDTDPDPTNNNADLVLTVECVVPVAVNIHPKSLENPVNLNSVVPLAVLTTEAGEYGLPLDFDATSILPTTVRFGPEALSWSETGGAFETHGTGHPRRSYELDEKTRDRDLDMVLHFGTLESGIELGDVEACVKGTFQATPSDQYKFFGCDLVWVVPPS